jgi:glycoside/pentoside/hexuronide:cation symporter, GPH family
MLDSSKSVTELKLPVSQSLIYALPAMPLALPTLVLFIYLPTLYVEEFGLSLAIVGLLLMLARVGDLVLDPLIGQLNDRLSGKQQRLTMLSGALICGIGLTLVTRPIEGWAGTSLMVALSLLYFGWTLVQIPYLAILPGIHPSSSVRTSVASLREGLGVIGLLLSAAIPVILIQQGATTLDALQQLASMTLIFGGISLAALLMLLNWPKRSVNMAPNQTSRKEFRTLLRNRPARQLMAAWFANGLANGIPAVLFPLYVTSVLGLDQSARAELILLYFIAAILSVPLWWFASKYYSRRRLWQIGMLISVAAFFPASMLGVGDQFAFTLICIITGATLGADLALPQAIQADVCDWHRFRYKRDQTGLLFALWNVFTKLALAMAAMLAFGLLELSGFDQTSNQAGDLPLIYALLPCVLKVIAVITLRRFGLNEAQHAAIIERLNTRR